LLADVKLDSVLTNDAIENEIFNSTGLKYSLLIPDTVFEKLVT
jgi:hypothetical protein